MNTIMILRTLAVTAVVCFVQWAACATSPSPDGPHYLARDGFTWVVENGATNRLEKAVDLKGDIRLQTNAVFRTAPGKERSLKEGQLLLSNGFILGSDGSLTPAMDHYAIRNGRLFVVRDGVAVPASRPVVLPSGDRIDPAGWIRRISGSTSRLMDGEWFALDGRPLPTWDVISRLGSELRIQKDGALMTVPQGRSLMMNDGTRILADGTIVTPGRTARQLSPGEYRLLPGVRRTR